MPEWENPAGGNAGHSPYESEPGELETSQYLEEEESTEMPGVVASETGRRLTVLPGAGL